MTTIETITRTQVAELQAEAQKAGDDAMVQICKKALVSIDTCQSDVEYPDTEALRECVRVIRDAEAMAD